MEKCKNLRIDNLANWRDPFARIQIINAVVFQELITNKINWVKNARERLTKYGIGLSEGTLKSILKDIKVGTRTPVAASAFRGDGIILPRPGKDLMYSELHCVERIFLQDMPKVYVGLPADQLLDVARQYDSGVACERDAKMYSYMCGLKETVCPNMKLQIEKADIFDFLKSTDKSFTVFDFDLMCFASTPFISKVAKLIGKTAGKRAIINFVSCIGRKCTEAGYNSIMPNKFIKELEANGFKEIWHRTPSGGYVDTWPMRFEIIVIER